MCNPKTASERMALKAVVEAMLTSPNSTSKLLVVMIARFGKSV